MFKDSDGNMTVTCEICSKLIINTPGRSHWRRSGIFIVKFEKMSQIVPMFPLLT